MIARQTAKKVRVWEIVNGTFVKKGGFEPSFVKTPSGEEVARARVLATIVAKFVAEDGNYAAVTLDDGSDTIRAKTFKTIKPLDTVEIGDIVDVIGKLREYNGEKYMMPEVVSKVTDPNVEVMRRLEMVYKQTAARRAKEFLEKNKARNPDELRQELSEKFGIEKPIIDSLLGEGGKKAGGSEKSSLKKQLLDVINASKDGIVYSQLMKSVKAKGADIESAVDELLNDGMCYEPSPGRIRKI
ncbi:MAG: OB-fold nucleic acid binding domain-containing protein [Candidatus Aenigmatarchaeota archaeon]